MNFLQILLWHVTLTSLLIPYLIYKHNKQANQKVGNEYLPFKKSKITIIESLELYIGALIFFWPRIIIAILLLTICSILIVLPSIFFAKNKPYPNFLRIYQGLIMKIFFRLKLFTFGVISLKTSNHQIQEYDPTYKSINPQKLPAFQISNHVSLFEVMIILSSIDKYGISAVAKSSIKFSPLGPLCIMMQNIFVDRTNKENKKQVLFDLQQRVQQIENGLNYSKIQLFPEGTRTNGQYLIKFQKGAFINGASLDIKLINYQRKNKDLLNGVFSLMLLYNPIEVINLGTFDPTYLGIKDYEKDWEIFAEKTRSIMAKALDVQISDSSIIEQFKFRESNKLKL